ncbi:MAG: SUF system Fe-S cluster assembly regulator [Legionellales bacterium RIFCSPHIGHO2_12_FULL_35_11]|nr:MAG: SUF system Fe-S cluster assembly regulator [Legionellales bacterium RIFCSPHIGHO2_12_FULL_35_11]
MLRISKLADYGTIVMVYLAEHNDKLCSARDISANTHISMPTVSKLLKHLTSAKLLTSVRGVSGGYLLQRDARAISLADIIYALDNTRGLTECSHEPNDCTLQSVCHVKGNWRIISQMINDALKSVSLEVFSNSSLNRDSQNNSLLKLKFAIDSAINSKKKIEI